jgi:hypothetical protein
MPNPAPNGYDNIIVAMGQSNMLGAGGSDSGTSVSWFNSKTKTWEYGTTIAFPAGNSTATPAKFCIQKLASIQPISLIPMAVSGSASSQWQPGQPFFDNTLSLLKTLTQTKKIVAFLWMQGENSGDRNQASTYATRLEKIYQGLKPVFNPKTLFICGEISAKMGQADIINQQLHQWAATHSNTFVLSNSNLATNPDNVHYTSSSLITIGGLFSTVIAKRYFNTSPAPAPIPKPTPVPTPVDITVLPKEIILNNITLDGRILGNNAIIRGKIAFTK